MANSRRCEHAHHTWQACHTCTGRRPCARATLHAARRAPRRRPSDDGISHGNLDAQLRTARRAYASVRAKIQTRIFQTCFFPPFKLKPSGLPLSAPLPHTQLTLRQALYQLYQLYQRQRSTIMATRGSASMGGGQGQGQGQGQVQGQVTATATRGNCT